MYSRNLGLAAEVVDKESFRPREPNRRYPRWVFGVSSDLMLCPNRSQILYFPTGFLAERDRLFSFMS